MRVAIVGSRYRPEQKEAYRTAVFEYILALDDKTVIVSGGCPNSPDALAEEFAFSLLKPDPDIYPVRDVDVKKHGSFGKAAFARNQDIVANCDRLVAFWNGTSRRTKNSIDIALKSRRDIEVYFL